MRKDKIIVYSTAVLFILLASFGFYEETKKVRDIESQKNLRILSTNEKDISSAKGSYFLLFGSYESSSVSNNKFIRMLAQFNDGDYRVIEVPISLVRFNISDNKLPYIKIKCSRDYVHKGDYSIDGFKIQYNTLLFTVIKLTSLKILIFQFKS